MKIDKALQARLETTFASLNKRGAEKAFPPPSSLSAVLEKLMPVKGVTTIHIEPRIATLFATAAVEVWLRAVHSFLISASLTGASPIWASTSGYYSSHYTVRAFAHLLGLFQLFRRKRIVRIDLQGGKHVCSFDPKQGSDREHRLYWKAVKRDPHFAADPLFTENDPKFDDPDDASDLGHRDRANYADHLLQYPTFRALDAIALKERVDLISQIEFTTPPIPQRDRFPDVESVQVVAYHRIVRFRRFLDEVLGSSSRFWNVHRNPSWTAGMIDFQLTDPGNLRAPQN